MEVLWSKGVTHSEAAHWERWLRAAEEVSAQFAPWEDDPFAYNETASVGILAAAAFRVGLIALPEYVARKASKEDKRKRVDGRCDLWLAAARSDWAFEFKSMIRGSAPRLDTLRARLKDAVGCADKVLAINASKRVGCLIVSTYPTFWSEDDLAVRKRLTRFSKEVDFAALIEPDSDYAKPVFFFMRGAK